MEFFSTQKTRPLREFSRNLLSGLLLIYALALICVLIVTHTITHQLVIDSLYSQVESLITHLPDNGNEGDVVRYLKSEEYQFFFRVTLLNDELKIIYDTQGMPADPNYLNDHAKLIEAMQIGYSYDEHFSSVTLQEMVYITLSFRYCGKVFLLRSSFPIYPIQQLQLYLQLSFFGLSSIIFLIFSLLTWLLISKLNRPLERILEIIARKSSEITDPSSGVTLIEMKSTPDDFDALIQTLNGLSDKVNRSLSTLSHERNEREKILRSMAEGVMSIGPQMQVIYANLAAHQILELDTSADGAVMLQDHRFDKLRSLCQMCLESQEPLTEEMDLPGSTKISRIELLMTPNGQGNINILVKDISQQHELIEMRKGFVANASHELRTPITIIRGFAETLRDHPEISGEMLQNIMEKIVTNCIRMNSLITQLMNLSKIENLPDTDLTYFNLTTTIEQVIDQMKQAHPTAIIHFENNLPQAGIRGQEVLISIVIKNLIENAIKYSDGQAKIDIEQTHHLDQVQLVIRDHGIGIPKEDLPYIFERFYTVDKARSKKVGGYGLGLAMVKTIIDKHRGTIQVDSVLKEGTTFTLRLTLKNKKSSPSDVSSP